MRNSKLIKSQLEEVTTIGDLTAALEGVASIKIAQIKDKVLPGRECFDELWATYSQLRVDPDRHKRFIAKSQERFSNNKSLYLLLTSEGNLSGLIDQKIVDYFITVREDKQADVVTLGSHGAKLLESRGIKTTNVFPLPEQVTQDEIQQVGRYIQDYAKITIFYQSYLSLNQQTVRTIDLIRAVATLGETTGADDDKTEIISSKDYFFEPSLNEIIKTMEATMLQIALREVILDSHLAQLASRFSAMLLAEDKARKRRKLLSAAWHKARRDESDRQQRERVAMGDAL